MMVVYRIARDKYIHDLSGEGAKMHGGRWNKPGTPALYTSQVRSLALLELVVHFNSAAAFAMNYNFACIGIDERRIIDVDLQILPSTLAGLNNHSLWDITETYFANKDILGVRVPSIIIPQEFNIVLNPLSFQYNDIVILNIESAGIDGRLQRTN
jgi:RES domain-containing protein